LLDPHAAYCLPRLLRQAPIDIVDWNPRGHRCGLQHEVKRRWLRRQQGRSKGGEHSLHLISETAAA
jgi:hypothetical protein